MNIALRELDTEHKAVLTDSLNKHNESRRKQNEDSVDHTEVEYLEEVIFNILDSGKGKLIESRGTLLTRLSRTLPDEKRLELEGVVTQFLIDNGAITQ
jgi:hypothetical protein